MRSSLRLLLLALLAAVLPGNRTAGADLPPPAGRPVDFAKDIQPLFAKACYECHGARRQRNGFRLDDAAGALKGGDLGPAILPGKSADSPLIHYVAGLNKDLVMPPKGDRLTPEQVGLLRAWIDQGAKWPESATARAREEVWWSLRPLMKPAPPRPAGADAAWARNPLDAFIIAKLREKGLAPSSEADRRTLIRRLYFDLIGLPPTPEEIGQVENLSYEAVVDRLLASPHYGERWARHWLDVVHYGETHGYDKDKPRPHAWPYRDYVIRAFNDDKPYGRFVQEQLAGDVLWVGTADGVEALGFLAAGPWDFIGHVELPETKIDGKVARHLDRDDMVSNTMSTFASLTVHCAQCHNHKFDSISQEDYYSLHAVFAALDRADRKYAGVPGLVYAGTVHQGTGNFAGTGSGGGKPRPIHVLARGDVRKPGKEVGPGALTALSFLPGRFELPPDHAEGERRAALAHWLTDARNPLPWRSLVNRVWLYHFGRGLVDTPNDFGKMGQAPTHPELLDWLAAGFRDGGQSLKQLHRLIVTSATYRQSSADNAEFARRDAGNAYYWQQNRHRLEAEAVRDSVLAVSGKLDPRLGGPSFQDFVIEKPEHSPHYQYHLHDAEDPRSHRRSVYRFVVRSQLQPFLTTMDCADPSLLVDKRNQTITPLQALSLLNNQLMVVMAKHFAARVERMAGSVEGQVAAAFRLALGRPPNADELDGMVAYVRRHGLANGCRVILNLNEFVFVD